MASLWEIVDEMEEFYSETSELGELSEDYFKDTWDALSGELREKVDACMSVIKQLRMLSEDQKAEAKNLQERSKVNAGKADALERYMQSALPERFKHESVVGRLNWRASSKTVLTKDPRDIPPQYCRVETVYKPSLTDLANDIKAGSEEAAKYAQIQKSVKLTVK